MKVFLLITLIILVGCSGAVVDSSVCSPKFQVESGPELTASQQFADDCFSATSKETCENVDVYSAETGTFGDTDGISDCEWGPKSA